MVVRIYRVREVDAHQHDLLFVDRGHCCNSAFADVVSPLDLFDTSCSRVYHLEFSSTHIYIYIYIYGLALTSIFLLSLVSMFQK